MQSIYTNPKPMVYEKRDEKKEEISKAIKKNDDITLSNSSSADDKADDENERIRKGLTKIFKEMKEADRELREEQEKRMKETMIYFRKSIVY